MRLRKALRIVPGYQFARRSYRSLTEPDFKNREELQSWITTGMHLQDRLQLEPIVFRKGKAFVQARDGIEYWWNPDVQGGVLDLEFGSDFERLEIECVLSYLSPVAGERSVFLDIGGNCGLYSLSVARHFPKSQTYCFEPVPTSQAMIRVNAEHNGLADQITLVGKALGDELKTVRMTASYSAMDHLIVGTASDELSPLIIEVPMTTVDNFITEHSLDRVDFIKCDVEGAELLVFKGAQQTLASFHPPILLEIEARHTERFGYAPEVLDTFLRRFGYETCIPCPADEVERLPSLREGIEQGYNNFLYLHRESGN
jgi:FkbM family methyltransferase